MAARPPYARASDKFTHAALGACLAYSRDLEPDEEQTMQDVNQEKAMNIRVAAEISRFDLSWRQLLENGRYTVKATQWLEYCNQPHVKSKLRDVAACDVEAALGSIRDHEEHMRDYRATQAEARAHALSPEERAAQRAEFLNNTSVRRLLVLVEGMLKELLADTDAVPGAMDELESYDEREHSLRSFNIVTVGLAAPNPVLYDDAATLLSHIITARINKLYLDPRNTGLLPADVFLKIGVKGGWLGHLAFTEQSQALQEAPKLAKVVRTYLFQAAEGAWKRFEERRETDEEKAERALREQASQEEAARRQAERARISRENSERWQRTAARNQALARDMARPPRDPNQDRETL